MSDAGPPKAARRPRGRPDLGPLRRSRIVFIRLRQDEWESLATAAAAAGLKPSALARSGALAAAIDELARANLPAPVQPVDHRAVLRMELRNARLDLQLLVARVKAGDQPWRIGQILDELQKTIDAAVRS